MSERVTDVEMENTRCLDMVCCSWFWFCTFYTLRRIKKKIAKRWYVIIVKFMVEISICWQQTAVFNSSLQVNDVIIITQQYTVCASINTMWSTCKFLDLIVFKDASKQQFVRNFVWPPGLSVYWMLLILPAAGGSMVRFPVPKLKRYSINRGGTVHSSSERARVRRVTSRFLWSK